MIRFTLTLCVILCIKITSCDVISLKENDHEGSLCYLRNGTRGQCRKSCSGVEVSEYEQNVCNPGKAPSLYCCFDRDTAQLYPHIHEACLDRMLAENMYSQLRRHFEDITSRLKKIDRVHRQRAVAIETFCVNMLYDVEEDERPTLLDRCLLLKSIRNPVIGVFDQKRAVRDPSIAGIGVSDGDSKNIQWICTGHFITSTSVLTSAHCITTNEEIPNVVRHGLPDLNHYSYETSGSLRSSTYDILNIIVHEQYERETGSADIALLSVLRDVSTESNVYMKPLPACLWTRVEVPSENLLFLGYSSIFHEGNPLAASESVCRINNVRSRGTTSCYSCGLEDTREVVGSLLFSEKLEQDIPYLLAVGTGSLPCRGHNEPALFTYVYPYLEWIENVISHQE